MESMDEKSNETWYNGKNQSTLLTEGIKWQRHKVIKGSSSQGAKGLKILKGFPLIPGSLIPLNPSLKLCASVP